jgi:Zn-dependent protease with chaperone function
MRQAQGERVGPIEAHRLFELLADLQRSLRAPPVERVVVTAEFNASVMQVSRLGPFGRRRPFLLLGLPLKRSLTVGQFAAVLAHELGHVVCGHGRRQLSAAYRMRQLLAQPGAASRNAANSQEKSGPLARRNEFEADALAAQTTSPRCTAQALTSVTLIGCYLEHRYWPTVHAAARESECGLAPFTHFDPNAIDEVSSARLHEWQDSTLKRQTGVCDTHPSLGERLEALGQPADFSPPTRGEAPARRGRLSFRRTPF